MTNTEIVQGLQVIKPKYQLEDTDERFERTRAVIDAAISRLSATCATCQWWDGRGKEDRRHRCLAHDGVTEELFCEDDVMWTTKRFSCNQHTPRQETP